MIEFDPLREDDLSLVAKWLEREHVREWWAEPAEVFLRHYRDALDGRDPTEYYLIIVDGRPVGIVQTYLVSDNPDWEEIAQVGPGTAGVDILIGEKELIGRGFGPLVLAEFVERVVFTRPETIACVATVDERNRRSWRAFEKAGFHHVRDVEEDGVPHRLMRLDRPSDPARNGEPAPPDTPTQGWG